MRTNGAGRSRDKFEEPGGPLSQLTMEPSKIVEGGVKGRRETQARRAGGWPSPNSGLKVAEQAAGAREGESHRPKFAQ
jgi:hypothetical protein